jgi:hypothetical protein
MTTNALPTRSRSSRIPDEMHLQTVAFLVVSARRRGRSLSQSELSIQPRILAPLRPRRCSPRGGPTSLRAGSPVGAHPLQGESRSDGPARTVQVRSTSSCRFALGGPDRPRHAGIGSSRSSPSRPTGLAASPDSRIQKPGTRSQPHATLRGTTSQSASGKATAEKRKRKPTPRLRTRVSQGHRGPYCAWDVPPRDT